MPGLIKPSNQLPSKRVLQDVPSSRNNIQSDSPSKKRKLNGVSKNSFKTPNGTNGHAGSSQPKSQFEEEVLEKLTQDMSGLKRKNAEKDQQWARPSLDDFRENKDNIRFQQIDVEEGTLHGGKTTIKLFGVTEVCSSCHQLWRIYADNRTLRMVIQLCYTSPTSCITSTLQRLSLLLLPIASRSRPTSRHKWLSTSPQFILYRW